MCWSARARGRAQLVLVVERCRARTCARVLIFRRVGNDKYIPGYAVKHVFIFIYIRERCLHFRPLVDRASIDQLEPVL